MVNQRNRRGTNPFAILGGVVAVVAMLLIALALALNTSTAGTGVRIDFAANSTPIAQRSGINLIQGTAIAITGTDGGIGDDVDYIINSTGSGGGGYDTIEDEDSALPQESVVNFTGAGVTCAAGTGQTDCTIPGGGAQDLAGVLSTGNTSGGTNIVLSGAGDTLNYLRTLSLVIDALTQTVGTGTAQIPNLGGATDQFVFEDVTQTLFNKTLDDFSNKIHADDLHIQLRNESGGVLTKGDAVYISGYSVGQDLALVTLADASSSSTMPAVALLEQTTLANNTSGEFIITGRISEVDSSAFSVGDRLYISNVGTTTNTLTSTKPIGTDLIQSIGEVLRSHASLGVIEVFGAGRVNDLPNIPDDNIWQGNSSGVAVANSVPDCNASNVYRLQYDDTTNIWSCDTDKIDLTVTTGDVTGILDTSNGGTGVSSFTDHGVLVGSGSGALSVTTTGSTGQVLTSNGSSADPTFQAASGGITEADQWRLTTTFSGDASPITSNLERVNSDGFTVLTATVGMTESSGIFTFPRTGYWLITFTVSFLSSTGSDTILEGTIWTTLDDSAYTNAVVSRGSLFNSSAATTTTATFLFDVTSVSTRKVQFRINGNSQNVIGSSVDNFTYMTFIRLGDT